ncbi:MAG: hypothetical protein ACYTAO_23000 [Planctomycetota bacterium]|jgi:hypothetical protein
MKIDDKKTCAEGHPLTSFSRAQCVRLVADESNRYIGSVYIVCTVGRQPVAVNLSDGRYRSTGLFVLEPNAKVVIE